ncbi:MULTISPECIES: thiol-disulfide oxidoreductase DCC family protein [unclassified Streptomyces]|uniref:thiol-disulfide oxidoreductase DCC family protein n=1 Tax=unclassified Streptomyces TaxID=2593676 RepID=UPI003806CAF0
MRTRPVLIYDGDCAFCTSSVRFAERRLRPRCGISPWQFADLDVLGVTQERAEYELLWVTPAGAVHGGVQAVAKLLQDAGRGWVVPGVLLSLPPFRWIAHGVYRLVANNRERMPGGTPACALPADRRSGTRAPSGHAE